MAIFQEKMSFFFIRLESSYLQEVHRADICYTQILIQLQLSN